MTPLLTALEHVIAAKIQLDGITAGRIPADELDGTAADLADALDSLCRSVGVDLALMEKTISRELALRSHPL